MDMSMSTSRQEFETVLLSPPGKQTGIDCRLGPRWWPRGLSAILVATCRSDNASPPRSGKRRGRYRDGVVEVVTAAGSEPAQRRVAGALEAAVLLAGDRLAVLLPASGGLLATVLGALRRGV